MSLQTFQFQSKLSSASSSQIGNAKFSQNLIRKSTIKLVQFQSITISTQYTTPFKFPQCLPFSFYCSANFSKTKKEKKEFLRPFSTFPIKFPLSLPLPPTTSIIYKKNVRQFLWEFGRMITIKMQQQWQGQQYVMIMTEFQSFSNDM
jgi:hypothetical protein